MDVKVRHESPRPHLEHLPKNGTMSHDNMTSSNSTTTTIQPGSSDSELCRLMSSGRSLESLADEDGEGWTPDTGGEGHDQMDINRCTIQMNSPAGEAGDTSADETAEYEDETEEDYGLMIEKRFQQLYGFKTPYDCRLLDDEWCNQVFKPSANVSLSWSNMQPLNDTAQEQFSNQHFSSAGQATNETEMESLHSFLQLSSNKSNECKYETSQQLVESRKVSIEEIPDTDTNSHKPIETLQLHESDDDVMNTENFATPPSGSRSSLRVEINSQSAIDGWTATPDSPYQQDSVQFASHGSKLLDTDNSCLEYGGSTPEHKIAEDIPAGTAEGDVPDQILPMQNEWPVNCQLNNHPLKFLYLINELAIMNDFVVVRNLVDTFPLTDDDRFAHGITRGDRCTIEEIDSDENTDRSTSESPTAANNLSDDARDKGLGERHGNEICKYTGVTEGRQEDIPKATPKWPEEYEQIISYSGGDVKKVSSGFVSAQEDSETYVQDQRTPGNKSTKIISNMYRNEHIKNNNTNETTSTPQITDTGKMRKSRIPRRKGVGHAFSCKPQRQPSCSMIQTMEGTLKRLKSEDLAFGGDLEAMLLSKNSRTPCDNRKTTTHQQLTDKTEYSRHETHTGLCSSKSENHISSTLPDGEQSETSCSSVPEHKTDDLKLPPIRQNRRHRELGSNVLPPNSLTANENNHRLKNNGNLKNKQLIRGQLLGKLTAIPARKQQASSTVIKLPSLSLQSTPIHKQSHPLAIRRPYTPPNRNVLEARAQWPQFYTSHQTDMDRGLPRRMALKDVPSLKKVPGFSYGVYD